MNPAIAAAIRGPCTLLLRLAHQLHRRQAGRRVGARRGRRRRTGIHTPHDMGRVRDIPALPARRCVSALHPPRSHQDGRGATHRAAQPRTEHAGVQPASDHGLQTLKPMGPRSGYRRTQTPPRPPLVQRTSCSQQDRGMSPTTLRKHRPPRFIEDSADGSDQDPWQLVMPGSIWANLRQHLLRGDGEEHGAVALAGIVSTQRGTRLLVRELCLARDGKDFVPAKNAHRRLTAEFVNDRIRYCRDHHLAYPRDPTATAGTTPSRSPPLTSAHTSVDTRRSSTSPAASLSARSSSPAARSPATSGHPTGPATPSERPSSWNATYDASTPTHALSRRPQPP